ncbi:MAG: hypothetical protein J5625_10515 [Lachnospiraceae bacterium]|nr:hypothetical protein [Lachnospiraceae bacterium]
MNYSILFENKPNKGWGSRGNPFFWDYLEKLASEIDYTIDADELEKWIKAVHLKLTGTELTADSDVFVEEFDYGGMSSGRITGEWWLTVGIPYLKEQLFLIR